MWSVELILNLRDVHLYWSTPRISPEQIQTLERQNLIERAPTDLCAIRLTEHGAFVKSGGPRLLSRVTPHSERRVTP